MAKNKDCVPLGGIQGVIIGISTGVVLGVPFGPLGIAAGVLLGMSAGLLVGAAIAWLLCTLFGNDDDGAWKYAKPRFSSLSLSARPNPAQKNTSCFINAHWTVAGNDDNALCEITYEIKAEAGRPNESRPQPAIRNNASTFGRASPAFETSWSQEHDGRLIEAEVTLVARKGNRIYSVSETVPAIRVPVLP